MQCCSIHVSLLLKRLICFLFPPPTLAKAVAFGTFFFFQFAVQDDTTCVSPSLVFQTLKLKNKTLRFESAHQGSGILGSSDSAACYINWSSFLPLLLANDVI